MSASSQNTSRPEMEIPEMEFALKEKSVEFPAPPENYGSSVTINVFRLTRVYIHACLHSRVFILTGLLIPSMITKMPGYLS